MKPVPRRLCTSERGNRGWICVHTGSPHQSRSLGVSLLTPREIPLGYARRSTHEVTEEPWRPKETTWEGTGEVCSNVRPLHFPLGQRGWSFGDSD